MSDLGVVLQHNDMSVCAVHSARPGHQQGVVAWFNPGYLAIFERERPRVQAKLAQLLSV